MIQPIKRIIRNRNNYTLLKKKLKELGTTFCSKLIIKLTSKIVIPDLYLQILKYEFNNRTNSDIAKTLPRFQKLDSLNEYIKYNEDKNNNNNSKIILELAWVSFYKYKKKLTFIKKANEDRNFFYLILNGNLSKLNLTFKKEKISIEEYLLYMIKMKLLQEKQIVYKCNKLNKAYVNLDINNFRTYFTENKNYNFKELKQRAKRELLEAGFKILPDNRVVIPNIENYIKLSLFQTDERNDTQTRFNLFIVHYIKTNTLSKGNYIGDLSPNDNNEGCSYICDKNCDICYVNKNDKFRTKLYDLMLQKYRRIFKEIKNKFYIFKDTSEDICLNNFVPLMLYKKYTKGEKILIQNSQYEGIYLVIDGEIKISISQTFNELSNTLVSLQYSIFNFKDYVSKIIKTIDIIKEFNLKYMLKFQNQNMIDMGNTKINNELISSNEYLSYFNGIKNIEFYNLGVGDIVGLNELFDYKTELYNFTAECISDEANLFFISKRNFNNIMEKENGIMNNVIQLIDLKAKTLIGKINNFRSEYRNVVINSLSNKKNKSFNSNNNKFYFNNKIKINDNKEDKKVAINTKNIKGNYININFFKNKEFIMRFKNNKNKKIPGNVKLFKNNELLNYLKNKKLFRSNSISESLSLNNINKNLLSNRYIYQPKYSNMFKANSTTNHFRKKILLKNSLLTPKSLTNYPIFTNERIKSQNKENEIKNNFNNFKKNLSNSNSNKIVFNQTVMQIGNGESLLLDIIHNQKKFDEFQNEHLNNEDLPSIKRKKKEVNIFKKVGKSMSLKKMNLKKPTYN